MGSSYRNKLHQRKTRRKRAPGDKDPEDRLMLVLPLMVMGIVIVLVGLGTFLLISNELGGKRDDSLEDNEEVDDIPDGATGPLFIALENVQGGSFRLNDLKGKVIVLDMMATWCGPCKLQMEELRQLRAVYTTSQLEIISVGVDLSESDSLLLDFKTEEEAEWPFVGSNDAFNEAFPASSIPTIYILDREGEVSNTHVGVTGFEVISSEIASLLA